MQDTSFLTSTSLDFCHPVLLIIEKPLRGRGVVWHLPRLSMFIFGGWCDTFLSFDTLYFDITLTPNGEIVL